MPMYDRICANDHRLLDRLEPIAAPEVLCPTCGASTKRAWLTKPSGVISDECDVQVRNGLCHEDGTPRRFTSKSEMHRFAKEHGWTNHVVHQGGKGGDKSKHTSRWI